MKNELNIFEIIKDEVNIKDVWSEFVGEDLNSSNQALCPFHREDTPSLTLNENENYFNCFGCDAGGDSIKLVELREGVTPIEACNLIAERFNLSLSILDEEALNQLRQERAEREELQQVYLKATEYYLSKLTTAHREFLKEKYGFDDDTIEMFKISYADGYLKRELEKSFSQKTLLKTGLFYRDDNTGELKDNFRDRIIFPYLKDGQPIFFAGRTLNDDKYMKYKNLTINKDYISNQVSNPIYRGILKNREALIITEGLTDCISASAADFDVVSLGTNGLSKNKEKELFKLVKRYKEVVIIFDNEDNPKTSKKAMNTAQTILEGTGVIAQIGELPRPEGVTKIDLADYLKEDNKLEPIITKSNMFIDILINNITKVNNGLKAIEKAEEIYPVLAQLDSKYERYYIEEIRKAISKVEGCSKTTLNKSDIQTAIEKERNKDKEGLEEFNPFDLANELLKYEESKGNRWFYSVKQDRYYTYNSNKGVWYNEENNYLKQAIRRNLRYHNKSWETNSNVNEVLQILKDDLIIDKQLEDKFNAGIEPNLKMINVKNGMLNWESKQLKEHSADYYSVFQLPIEYDPKAQCPTWEKTLKEWINNEDSIKFLQEFAGYCLIPDTSLDKALILYGEGSNGKSIFLEVLKAMYGKDNCSNKTLHNLSQRFGTVSIKDKLVNICPDIDPTYLERTGTIKAMIAGEEISGEYKHGAIFDFRPVVRLLFSANELPNTRDKSYGWIRRIEIVEFPNIFEGNKRDPYLKGKLLKELSGVLNWALGGLQRLRKQEQFTISKSMQRSKGEYTKDNDSIKAYIEDKVILTNNTNDFIETQLLFDDYKRYCEEAGIVAHSRKIFTRRLKSELNIDDNQKRVNGSVTRGFSGINADIFRVSL